MVQDREFAYKKVQIEQFLKKEFDRHFGRKGRISVRKRQRFMERVTRKISKRFGKDVLCLVDFSKQGFVTLVSPSNTESTYKGKLYLSFAHPQVAYTTHCVERFSERTGITDNCIITLDAYLQEALLDYGQHEGHLVCSAGIFAYEIDNERLVIKTFINFELLSDDQIRKFYGPAALANLTEDMIMEDPAMSDIILVDELPSPTPKSGN